MPIPITDADWTAIYTKIAQTGQPIALKVPEITWLAERGMLSADEQKYLLIQAQTGQPVQFGTTQAQEFQNRRISGNINNANYVGTMLSVLNSKGASFLNSMDFNTPQAGGQPTPDNLQLPTTTTPTIPPINPYVPPDKPPDTTDSYEDDQVNIEVGGQVGGGGETDWQNLPKPTWGPVEWPNIDYAKANNWTLNQYLGDAASRAYDTFTGGAPPTKAAADYLATLAEQAFNSASGDAGSKMQYALNAIVNYFTGQGQTGPGAGTPAAANAFPKPDSYIAPKQFGATAIPQATQMGSYVQPGMTTKTTAPVAAPSYYQAPPASFELPTADKERLDRITAAQRDLAIYELTRGNEEEARKILDQLNQRNLLFTSAVPDRMNQYLQEQSRGIEGITREAALNRLTAEQAEREAYWSRGMAGQQFGVGQEQFSAQFQSQQRLADLAQSLQEAGQYEDAQRVRAQLAEQQRQFDTGMTEQQRQTNIDQELRSATMQEAATMERAGMGYDVSKFLMGLEETKAARIGSEAIEREKIGLSKYETDLLEAFRRAELGQQQGQFESTLGQRESEFGRTIGEEQRQFDTNAQLRERQFLQDVTQYGLDYALQQDKFREEYRQFEETMAESTRQFNTQEERMRYQQSIDMTLKLLGFEQEWEIEKGRQLLGYYAVDASAESARDVAELGLWGSAVEGAVKGGINIIDWILGKDKKEEPTTKEPEVIVTHQPTSGVSVEQGGQIVNSGTGQLYYPPTTGYTPYQPSYGQQSYTPYQSSYGTPYTQQYTYQSPYAGSNYAETGYYPDPRLEPRPLPGSTSQPARRTYY